MSAMKILIIVFIATLLGVSLPSKSFEFSKTAIINKTKPANPITLQYDGNTYTIKHGHHLCLSGFTFKPVKLKITNHPSFIITPEGGYCYKLGFNHAIANRIEIDISSGGACQFLLEHTKCN